MHSHGSTLFLKESPKIDGITEKGSVMRLPTLIRFSGTAAAVCAALVLTAGCGTDTESETETESDSYGAAVGVGDGTARSYVLPDADGNPSAIGLGLTADALDGTWDGRWTVVEPMMAIDWMCTKTPVQEDLELPQPYQQAGYYPTTYSVSFDENSGEYVVELGGLTMREAS